jgi:hypothetical protein
VQLSRYYVSVPRLAATRMMPCWRELQFCRRWRRWRGSIKAVIQRAARMPASSLWTKIVILQNAVMVTPQLRRKSF